MASSEHKLTLFVSVSIEASELWSLEGLRTPRGAKKARCEGGAFKGVMLSCERPDASIIAKLVWLPEHTNHAVKGDKKNKVKEFLQ